MKILRLAASALMISSFTAPVAIASSDGATFALRAFGYGRWTVTCDLERERGRNTSPRARGDGSSSSGVVLGRKVVGGSCSATANERGPLSIELEDRRSAFDCPFDIEDNDNCKITIAAGQTVEFDIALTDSEQ